MGHRRIGVLPRTRHWRAIVEQLAEFGERSAHVGEIVRDTTDGARKIFDAVERDASLLSAFHFLTALPVASRTADPQLALQQMGFAPPTDDTPLALARSLRQNMPPPTSTEYAQLVERAAIETIAQWVRSHKERDQTKLFELPAQPFDAWRRAANGSGFCELSRSFFAAFINNSLSYLLDREASGAIREPRKRDAFAEALETHINAVSQHAFETARLTQSFAAGWFNNHARMNLPSKRAMRGFIRHALAKLKEEMRREGRE